MRFTHISTMSTYTQSNLTNQLTTIADQLRSLSNNGLRFSEDPYQTERYHKILGLAAQLLSITDERTQPEIEQLFFTDLNMTTPLAVVDTAVFDEADRILLIQRADNHTWAMPGGACDVGETPAQGGAREVWEESGYEVQITDLLGVFDSRLCGARGSRHLYQFLFAAKVIGGDAQTSIETLDVRWFPIDEIPWELLDGGHPQRIRHALAWRADPATRPYWDRLHSSG